MTRFWRALKKWVSDHDVALVLTILITLAVFVYLAPSILVSIRPGEIGVLWSRFGEGTLTTHHDGREFVGRIETNDKGEPTNLRERHEMVGEGLYPYREGMRLKFPWDEIYIYDIRMQERQHTYDVLASDGLDMEVIVSIRWKPITADIAKLHRDIGPDYINTLIIPIVGSHAREQIGQYRADELYSEKRLEIQKKILARVKKEMTTAFYPEEDRESFVVIENVLIRSIKLPEIVKKSIQEKVQQKHLADSYVYRLERELQEAQRKEIEARGIEQFQQIIHGSISEPYLKWKGIDATLALARSDNAKIVVIGAGESGMPIILGGLGDQLPKSAALGSNSNDKPGDSEMFKESFVPEGSELRKESSAPRESDPPQRSTDASLKSTDTSRKNSATNEGKGDGTESK